jgi:hypothetical protein
LTADPTDPLEVALLARKKNNNEPIPEAEARKQKLAIPKPLKHKMTGPDHQDIMPVAPVALVHAKTDKSPKPDAAEAKIE